MQPADVAPQLQAQLEVDAGGRLVEDDQARLVHERPGQQQARRMPPESLGARTSPSRRRSKTSIISPARWRASARFMP